MEIVILDAFTTTQDDLNFDKLKAMGNLRIYERTKMDEVVSRAYPADILLVNKIILSRDILDQLPNLKYIGLMSTGYNVVDLAAAKERNIPVCNIPAYSTPSVAQLTFSLILEICNGVGKHSEAVAMGEWNKAKDFCIVLTPQIELYNKTLGIIGYGSIGKSVEKIALALGMKVIAYSRTATSSVLGGLTTITNSLDTLYQCSDIITLHCPLDANNTGFVNENTISKMKDGVILINTARGALIDDFAVTQALKSGKMYAFGADVLSSEPPKPDNPLQGCPNAFITPHIAWASKSARSRLVNIAVQNVENFFTGNPSNNVAK